MDIFDKAGMDTVGKVGIAADITCNASHATRLRVILLRIQLSSIPNIGRNNREHILLLVRHGCLE